MHNPNNGRDTAYKNVHPEVYISTVLLYDKETFLWQLILGVLRY